MPKKSTTKSVKVLLMGPNISLALATRWLAYKKLYAERILKRNVTADEVIQFYKGIYNDKSKRAVQQMDNFRGHYAKF